MAIDLTGPANLENRRAASRRLVKLPQELVVFDLTITNTAAAGNSFSNVDNTNDVFLANWLNIANQYITERANITGDWTDTFLMAEVTALPPYPDTLNPDPTNKFFSWTDPPDPANDNFYVIPQINEWTAGVLSTPVQSREQDHARAHLFLVDSLINGWGGGLGLLQTTCNAYVAGAVQLVCASTAGMVAGNCLMITDPNPPNASRVLYIRNVVNLTTIDVYDMGGTGNLGNNSVVTIRSAGVNWTNAQRNNFPAIDAITGIIDAYCRGATWATCLVNEAAALVLNDDLTYAAQIATARANILTIQGARTIWLALGVAGPGCMYNDAGLTAFRPAVVTRVAQIVIRVAQLVIAMGSITAGPNGTFVPVAGAIANRYVWLDKRINKGYGSRAQSENMTNTRGMVIQQAQAALAEQAGYRAAISAAKLKDEPDGTRTIKIDLGFFSSPSNYTPFLPGDSVMVTDDAIDVFGVYTHTELTGTLLWIYPDGRCDLDFEIPIAYTKDYLVRLFKLL